MLKKVNKYYFILGFVLFLLFLPQVDSTYYPIYILNFLALLSYALLIFSVNKSNPNFFTKKRLVYTVFIYSLFFVYINNLLSYLYTGDFFMFSEGDALYYHEEAIRILTYPTLYDGILSFLNLKTFADLGAILFFSILYSLIESNLFVNFIYIIAGCVTALSIFSISKNFMSVKYAFYAALTFSISSYMMWFHASGLKESIMTMIVAIFYNQYFIFRKKKLFSNILYVLLAIVALLFFRPILSVFCLLSIGVSFLLSKNLNFTNIILIIFISGIFIYSFSIIEKQVFAYMGGQNVAEMLESQEKDGKIQSSLSFTYATYFISAAIGPLPTFVPNIKTKVSFYASGLLFRVIISLFFWYGAYYAYKFKLTQIYPLVLFPLIEMASLVFIMQALELRKSLIHFPMVYIVAFWMLYLYDTSGKEMSFNKKAVLNISRISMVAFFILIIFWNQRL